MVSGPFARARRRALAVVVFAGLLVPMLPVPPALASGTVSTCDEASFLAALSGGGSVTFTCSGTINTTATIVLSSPTSINGAGQDVTIRGGGGSPHQLFRVQAGVTATISNLTLQAGNADGVGGNTVNGGAIDNAGDLTISRVTFRGNTATGSGGAIAVGGSGTLGIEESTFQLNQATGTAGIGGGGAIVADGGALIVEETTFLGNSATGGGAPDGGAIRQLKSTLTSYDNTFVGNFASGSGAAIAVGHVGSAVGTGASINNNTFATNASGSSVIFRGTNATAGVDVYNSVIVHQQGPNCAPGFSLFTNSANNIEWGGSATCASVGQSGFTIADPRLGPLTANGPAGAPMTMLPTLGSALIDAGDNAYCVDPDANGTARDATCDVGATQATGALTKTYTIDSPGNEADTNTADGTCSSSGAGGACTLRAAIQQVNADALAAQTSLPFSIPVGVGGPFTAAVAPLTPSTAYPQLNRPVSIDGSTQYSYSVAGGPVIRISGASIPGQTGLSNGASVGSTVIRGLAITDFSSPGGVGLCACGSGTNTIAIKGNYVGTDGSSDLGNMLGIWATQNGAVIGGSTAADRNVVSGNGPNATSGTGIKAQAANVSITGNYVGTNAAGTADLGTQAYGVDVAANATTIGGSGPGQGNVISGNDHSGISLSGVSATNTVIKGNYIGTDATGNSAIPNPSAGILFNGAGSGVVVGGPNPGDGNVMATATNGAMYVLASSSALIQGNSIGVNATETALLGSPSNYGVRISGAGNAVSPVANSNTVVDNVVGGATTAGIAIDSSAIGTAASSNVIGGNFVGTDRTETLNLGNTVSGIQITGPLSSSNTIGTLSAPNVVAYNGGGTNGGAIRISTGAGTGSGNTVAYNRVSSNAGNGIYVVGGTGTTVGPLNTVWGNSNNGVKLVGTTNATVKGNTIGLRPNGTASGNSNFGISVGAHQPTLAANNTGTLVGGTGASDVNVVVNNAWGGIFVGNAGSGTTYVTSGASVHGNRVGVTAANAAGPNGGGSGAGIAVGGDGGNHDITIGGAAPGEANIVANNFLGVTVATAATPNVRVKISGNSISNTTGGLGIDLGTAGVTPNDALDADTGANDLQNFPVLSNAGNDGIDTSVDIDLDSTPSTDYSIELFSSPTCDGSGNGEGATYLASVPATTNASGQFSTTYVYAGLVPVTHVLTATATVTTAGPTLGDTSEFSACATVSGVVPNDPDLEVTQTDDGPKNVGQDLTYTITVENIGTAPATGISLSDTLPSGVTFVSATPGVGDGTCPGSDFPCALNDLNPTETATITLVVTPTTAGTKTNVATVTSTGDINASNDESSHDATVNAPTNADLVVSLSDDGPVYAGQNLTFTVDVDNAGPGSAVGLNVAGTLSGGATLVSATPESGTCGPAAGGYLCLPSDLPSGQTETITVVVATPVGVATLGNEVDATSTLNDPNPADNTDVLLESTTLDAAPGFAPEENVAMPAGTDGASFVATGTFDDDGPSATVDVAVTNPLSGDVSIFLNDDGGNLAPASPASYAVGGTPRQIVAGNVDGAAGPDLLINTGACPSGPKRCLVLLSNEGDGTFTETTAIQAPDDPEGIALADVDGDGDLDLILANSKTGGGSSDFSVFLGDGAGGFNGGTQFGSGGGFAGVDVADLDADGNVDVVLAGGDLVTVYLGDGVGSFTKRSDTSVGAAATEDPYPVVGDFDADGYVDVAVNGSVHVLFGRGNGEFRAERVDLLTGEQTVYLAVLDVNQDGSDDIVAARKAPVPAGEPALKGFFGRGNGGFDPGDEAFLRFPATNSIAAADLDDDGKKDLIVPNGIANKLTLLFSDAVPAVQSPLLATDDTTAVAGAAEIDTDEIDLLTLGLGDGTLAGAAGPEAAPVGKNPVGKNPVGKNPVGKNPVGKNPVGKNGLDVPSPFAGIELSDLVDSQIPSAPLLSEMILDVPGGWRSVLASDDLRPLQEISLNDVIDRPQVRDIDLSMLDYSGSILESLPPVALLAGSTPLSDIPLPTGDWSDLLGQMGPGCGAYDESDSLVHLALARCDLSVVPWSQMPLTTMDLSGSLIEDYGLTGLDSRKVARPGGSPALLSGLTLDRVPLGIVDCEVFIACASSAKTLEDVENTGTGLTDPYGFEIPDPATNTLAATFGMFLNADPNRATDPDPAGPAELLDGITFEEVLLGIVEPESFPYELVSVESLLAAAPADPAEAVTYRAAATVACDAASGVTFVVTLPDGRWRYVEGSATFALTFAHGREVDPAAEPTITATGALSFDWPPNPCDAGEETVDAELTFDAQPAPAIGTFEAGFVAQAAGGVHAVSPAGAPVTLSEANTPNDDPATAPQMTEGNLYFSQFAGAGDVNYFQVPVSTDDVGSLMVATISNFDGDVDAVLYGTPAAFPSLRSAAISSFGAGSTGLGDQEGCLPNGYVVEPMSTEGVPLLSEQSFVPRGYSTNRSNQAEIVCTVVQEGDLTLDTNNDNVDDTGVLTLQILRRSGDATGPVLTRFRFDEELQSRECVAPAVQPVDLTGIWDAYPAPAIVQGASIYYLINEERIAGLYGVSALTDLLDGVGSGPGLRDLAAQTDGVIIPVERDPQVQGAYAALNADPCSPELRNRVVAAVNASVDDLRGEARPGHVVIVGSDAAIPLAAKLDRTGLGNQVGYALELRVNGGDTPISRAFARGLILTDDPYGSFEPESYLGDAVYLPAAGIGRLVETPQEMLGQIEAFVASDGELDTTTALVTGADFSKDVGRKIRDAFDDRAEIVSVNDVLAPAPTDLGLWDRDDMICQLNGSPTCGDAATPAPNLLSINGHFSHSATETGNSELYVTDDFAASQVPPGALLFTIGCNSGVNVEDFLGTGGPETLDWAQALAQRNGVLIANNGFGYGDTNAIAYSERLSLEFATQLFQLRPDGSPFTVGEALAIAKANVYAGTGTFTPYDVKSIEIATLYGLPMYTAADPGDPVTPPSVTPATDPDTGLQSYEAEIADFILNRRDRRDTARGEFFRKDPAGAPGTGPVLVSDGNPYQPRSETIDVTVDGLEAHGALLTDLNVDLNVEAESFDPVYSTTLLDGGIRFGEPLVLDVTYPNEFGAVANVDTVFGDRSTLVMFGGRFTSDLNAYDGTGTQRIHNAQTMRVFYSTSSDFTGPQVSGIEAIDLGNNFAAFTVTSLSTDVAAVYVNYRRNNAEDAEDAEDFDMFRLTPAGTQRWSGTIQVPQGVAEYFVQLVDKAGNVRVWQTRGQALAPAPAQPAPVGVRVDITGGTPVNGWYPAAVQVGLSGGYQTFQHSIDGGPVQPYGGPAVVTPAPVVDGVHTFAWTGSYGTSGTEYIPIDANPPTIDTDLTQPVHQSAGTTWIGEGSTVTVHVTDQGSGVGACTITITPAIVGAPTACGGGIQTISFAGAAEGPYSIAIDAADNANHSASETVEVVYDMRPPDITESVESGPFATNDDALYVTSASDLDVDVTDPPAGTASGSGVDTCDIEVTGPVLADPTCVEGPNLVKLQPKASFPDGAYTVSTDAVDNLGQGSDSSYPVRLDNTAPVIGACPVLPVPQSAVLVNAVAGSPTARTLTVNEMATPPRTPFTITVGTETMTVTNRVLVKDFTTRYTYTVMRGATPQAHAAGAGIAWSLEVRRDLLGRLNGAIGASQATITVTTERYGLPSVPFTVQIDGERLRVDPVAGPVWTVTRAVDGTTASAHTTGTQIIWVDVRQAVYVDVDDPDMVLPVSASDPDLTGPPSAIPGSGLVVSPETQPWNAAVPTSDLSELLPIDEVGTYRLRYRAVDRLGNDSVKDCWYEVIYRFNGVYKPIELSKVNVASAGQGVGVKWTITDADGVPFASDSTFVAVTSSSAISGACTNTPQFSVTDEFFKGGSSLQNLGAGNYQYNWAVPKSYGGSCRTMGLRLHGPGTGPPPAPGELASRRYQWANFQFKTR